MFSNVGKCGIGGRLFEVNAQDRESIMETGLFVHLA